jgi:hypothetical protein
MGTALTIIWGIALLIIAALLGVLALTLKRGPQPAALAAGEESARFEPAREILLFEYAQEDIRSTADDSVIVRIPGISWDPAWQKDLIRLEIDTRPQRTVQLTAGWENARVIAAYRLHAYRMTDMGADVAVNSFSEPIEIVFTTTEKTARLEILTQTDGEWTPVPQADISAQELASIRSLGEREWRAGSVRNLGLFCLVRPVP